MASTFASVFSNEDIEYINNLPEVLEAKAKLTNSGKVYFDIQITETIRSALHTRLGLDLSKVDKIPMSWIKGDTAPHVDSGYRKFNNTYLVYLNNNSGDFIVGEDQYSIEENTAFIFNEGISHKTQNTGSEPRLLVGPMNEYAEPVGTSLQYYSNYMSAIEGNNNWIGMQAVSWILNDTQYLQGYTTPYTTWRIASPQGFDGVYSNGFDLSTLPGFTPTTYLIYPSAPCFLEGTKVLCQVDGAEVYTPIESIKSGPLVKTSSDGFKKAVIVGQGDIINLGNDGRIENRLYKCTPENYPELTEDLYLTGCHSILVNSLTDVQYEKTMKQLGDIFITDNKYRLIACLDERSETWKSEGKYNIWNIALENESEVQNYGIYVNGGLLVESCPILFMKRLSNMKFM